MRRFLLIPLMIVLVSGLIFGGCAAPAPAPAPIAPTPGPEPTPVPGPAPAPSPGPVGKTWELRLAHHNPPKSRVHVKFIEPWTKQVEEATAGRVKITIFPAQSLAKSTEVIEAVKGGVADITWQTIGTFPGRFKLTEVTSLPFINIPSGVVGGCELSGGAINSRIVWELYEEFPEIQAEWDDVKVLILHTSDPYFLITNKPVRNRADLKGMLLREIGGPPTDMWKLLGASPINIPFPGIYEAGEKGVIEGAGMLWSGLGSFRLYEIFHYKTNVSTTTAGFFVIMNKDVWNSFTPDIQDAIMSVSGIKGAEFAGDAAFGDAERDVRKQMQEEGYKLEEVNLDAGEYEQWEEIAGKPLWDNWVSKMMADGLPGDAILSRTLNLMEQYGKK